MRCKLKGFSTPYLFLFFLLAAAIVRGGNNHEGRAKEIAEMLTLTLLSH
jgi:hypothetical protein